MLSDISERSKLLAVRDGGAVDETLAAVSMQLQKRGLQIAGFLQREVAIPENCCAEMYLESIASARTYRISQSLGSGSKGCRLNPGGLADAAGALLADIEAGTDVLIINRFGKGETDGHGFRAAIETAISCDIPVIMAVRDAYLDAFRSFVGDLSVDLADDVTAIVDWCVDRQSPRDAVRAA